MNFAEISVMKSIGWITEGSADAHSKMNPSSFIAENRIYKFIKISENFSDGIDILLYKCYTNLIKAFILNTYVVLHLVSARQGIRCKSVAVTTTVTWTTG